LDLPYIDPGNNWSVECSPKKGLVNPPTEHDACHGKGEENPGRRAVACREWRMRRGPTNDEDLIF